MKLYSTFILTGYFMMVLPLAFSFTIAHPKPSAMQHVSNSCPTRCKCNIIQHVNCSGLGLREIPGGLPSDTSVLDLSYNRISHLNVQRLKQLPRLRELNLRKNNVTLLPGDIWSKLPQLKILDLSSNTIACSCPLDWLEKQFRSLRWDIRLVNQNQTDCDRYRMEGIVQGTSLKLCLIKQRWKRSPSCEAYHCRNGGTCRPGRQPMCECVHPFYGRNCEFRTGYDRAVVQGDDMITVDRVTATSIAISWNNGLRERGEVEYIVEVSLDSPSTQSLQREPIVVSFRNYVVDKLQPSTLYKICVSVLESKEQVGCIVQMTHHMGTTVESVTGPEKDITFGVMSGDNEIPNKHFPGNDKHKPKGEEMQYAFISVAAVFGISMFLTIVIGFAYYRRVHSNVTEVLPGTEYQQNVTSAADNTTAATSSRPPVENIVLVSRGNETTDRGILNPAYEPHITNVSNDGANLGTEDDDNSKRLVRFTLPHHSQDINHLSIPDETIVNSIYLKDQDVLEHAS